MPDTVKRRPHPSLLSLRARHFLPAELVHRLTYLKSPLAAILVFVSVTWLLVVVKIPVLA